MRKRAAKRLKKGLDVIVNVIAPAIIPALKGAKKKRVRKVGSALEEAAKFGDGFVGDDR